MCHVDFWPFIKSFHSFQISPTGWIIKCHFRNKSQENNISICLYCNELYASTSRGSKYILSIHLFDADEDHVIILSSVLLENVCTRKYAFCITTTNTRLWTTRKNWSLELDRNNEWKVEEVYIQVLTWLEYQIFLTSNSMQVFWYRL